MMRLSAAIRIGSMTTKQIRGRAHDGGNGRCAIGAAIDASGGGSIYEFSQWSETLAVRFPIVLTYARDPITDIEMLVGAIIWRLNDHFVVPREKIADWVETIENQMEAKETQKEAEPCHC